MAAKAALEGKTIDITPDDVTDAQDDLDAEISQIFAEFGGGSEDTTFFIKVYRVIEGKGEFSYLFQCTPAELPILDRLRDEHGGGLFEMRIYEETAGKKTLRRRPKVRVEAPKNKPAPPPTSQPSDLSAILKTMQDGQERMFTQLQTIMAAREGVQTAPADPFAQLKSITSIIKDLVPAQPSGGGLKDMIETMAALKEIMPESKSNETNWMDLAAEALKSPQLVQLLEGAVQGAKNRLPPPAAVPGAASAAATPEKTPQEKEADMLNAIINQFMAEVLEMARTSEDPGFAAEAILRKAKRFHVPVEQVKLILLQPESLDNLAKNAPDVNTYRQWFEMVQAEIKDMIEKNELP